AHLRLPLHGLRTPFRAIPADDRRPTDRLPRVRRRRQARHPSRRRRVQRLRLVHQRQPETHLGRQDGRKAGINSRLRRRPQGLRHRQIRRHGTNGQEERQRRRQERARENRRRQIRDQADGRRRLPL
ncbi:MAG: hypothetical protein AVDCRST_MAG73-3979, partial [uncultured Thermomicrobiales bacterium]